MAKSLGTLGDMFAKPAASTIRDELEKASVDHVQLKFTLTEEKFGSIIRPIGAVRDMRPLAQVKADEGKVLLNAIRAGFPHRALLGRVRSGVHDTGTNTINVAVDKETRKGAEICLHFLWKAMQDAGFKLAYLSYTAKQIAGGKHVYTLVIGAMVNPEKELDLTELQQAVLSQVISATWGSIGVWINLPGNPTTVNCNFMRGKNSTPELWLDYIGGEIVARRY